MCRRDKVAVRWWPYGLRYLLPRLTGRKLQYQRMLTDLAVFLPRADLTYP